MNTNDREKTLARLTATDVASLKAQNINETWLPDKMKAFKRIRQAFGLLNSETGLKYKSLITKLQSAELTINFVAYKFFNTDPRGTGYVNIFENNAGKPIDQYMKNRDQAEENLFDYSNQFSKPGDKDVIERIKKLGNFNNGNNQNFQPIVRPTYAALNYTHNRNGAASIYGESYAELKRHIKFNSTFTYKDSLFIKDDKSAINKVANYTNLQRLLVNFSDEKLRELDRSSRASGALSSYLGEEYIETQIHGGIVFARDVHKIYISRSEMSMAESRLKAISSMKVINSKTLEDTFKRFTTKYGILLDYI
jgi:hypothetical protein